MELFLKFFDILGPDIPLMVEEYRVSGAVSWAINATFLALIPKSATLVSFTDLWPISLYNILYKIIAKIRANQIKHRLVVCFSKEQFGFLNHRLIFDAIGVA